jgi:hypothetical protein
MDKQDNHQTAEACGLLHPEFEVGRFLLLVIEILSEKSLALQSPSFVPRLLRSLAF